MATAASVPARRGIIRRPTEVTGWWSWFTTVDHKKIGLLYGFSAFMFFLIGGVEALLIRSQLAKPDNTLLNADQYNQIFTMHGITMIFLFVMPMSAAFFNYLIPLMIGARDVAFPRLNAFSFWVFILGGLFLYSSWFLGGAPNGGWFGYPPNSTTDPSIGMTFYALGLVITGIASSAGAVNLAVTVVNMRAPGMTLFRMPVFVWMGLVVQFLLVFALPIITVALFEMLFDRRWGTHFFDPTAGGQPLLWQNLFWLFGHPEVYILILPAFGIISEILPVFSRKPLFGYIHFDSPMLFAVGAVAMFVIGGLSGVTHAVVPSDYQQTDTYYIVAHFHYVLFGGAVFGLFGAMYYWWPKVFARQLNERWGKVQFWILLVGFNLTFGPMHILGLEGMIRREYTYPASLGLTFWNQVSTVGAFLIALSTLVFILNAAATQRRPKGLANEDPWDARTLEWSTSCPPPIYNFEEIPVVHSIDEFWHRKYVEDKEGRLVRVPAGASDHPADGHKAGHAIHLPSPSFWPLVAAVGLPVMAYGVLYSWWLVGAGAIVTVVGFMGWAMEPPVAE